MGNVIFLNPLVNQQKMDISILIRKSPFYL